jgi:hypothetical protein
VVADDLDDVGLRLDGLGEVVGHALWRTISLDEWVGAKTYIPIFTAETDLRTDNIKSWRGTSNLSFSAPG